MATNTAYDLNLGWDTFENDIQAEEEPKEKVSVTKALVMSLNKNLDVDIRYISRMTGMDADTVIEKLRGSVYQNPEKWNGNLYDGWELSSEYFSGNLFEKHRIAKEASARFSNRFDDNVSALENYMNLTVYFDDVRLVPGMAFVPPNIIDDFIEHLFGEYISSPEFKGNKLPYLVKRDAITGSWEIPFKSRYRNSVANFSTYGTFDMEGISILEAILNNRDIVVMNKASSYSKKRTINKAATAKAIEKKEAIIAEFDKWAKTKSSPQRKIIEACYIREYGFIRKRVFDGSFLEKKWGQITLRHYQLNAVARILFTMNCMLALPVGRGKTFIILVSAMEAIRTNIAKKIIITPPNNVFIQFQEAAYQLGCIDNIRFIGTDDFKASKRQAVLESIRSAETGIFVIPQSCFELIPLSEEYYRKDVKNELDKVVEARGKYLNSTSGLKRRERELRKALREIEKKSDDKNKICFDDLGINMIFIDEVQAYKNITIDTSSLARGINRKGSVKANKTLDKIHYIQKMNGGKGVVLSTGTPITNSMTDIFVWQKMLQSGELAINGLNTFDAWAAEFCEKTTEFEIDVNVSDYRLVTRYSKFVNLPELTSLFSSVAEFYTPEESEGLPLFKGYTDIVIPHTVRFKQYLEEIANRCEEIRNGNVSPEVDNMLKLTHDSIAATTDMRLVYPDAPFSPHSKVAYCSDKVHEIYAKTHKNKCTQLVFCDISTPKDGFNLYDELKRLLVEKGVRPDEIAYIHDATDDKKREKLFEATRKGDIRVLIGSTMKLGTGVNVQDKCIAIHHLSIPFRPSDMQQREGRILRQGNTNKEVFIFRYVVQASFDAYSYQLLENKQRVVSQILKGAVTSRSIDEVDDSVLSYGEIKALAVGNPLIRALKIQSSPQQKRRKQASASERASGNSRKNQGCKRYDF